MSQKANPRAANTGRLRISPRQAGLAVRIPIATQRHLLVLLGGLDQPRGHPELLIGGVERLISNPDAQRHAELDLFGAGLERRWQYRRSTPSGSLGRWLQTVPWP
jgi:hypothetical protein